MRVIIFVVASSLVVSLAAAQCCPPYWTQFYEGCYRVIGTRRKWQDAENDCKKLSPSGRFAHLASINDYYEQQFVTALCAESLSGYTNDVWIGASDIRVEGRAHPRKKITEGNAINPVLSRSSSRHGQYFLHALA